ncbi:MAG TPA: hypothetical protein VN281_20255, partial [Verrucomicrobiae bacterium]|nr:hypothetical protein [Verrucomicrobiae bacterium]
MLRGVTLPFRLLFALGFALIVFVQFGRSIDPFDGMTNEQTPLGHDREPFFGMSAPHLPTGGGLATPWLPDEG